MNGLDLFSGIGGLTIALSEWVRPIAYCEIDPYCQGVLLSRMSTGELTNCPIWDDIKTLEGSRFVRGYVDIIFGGFPCQDISIAKIGNGLAGKRSVLFYEIVRLCGEIKPRFIFLENVPAITSRGGCEVVRAIASMGYDCRWCVISAESIGAPHKRERWFILAHSQSERFKERGLPMREETTHAKPENCFKCFSWDKEPENRLELARVDDGIPFYVDRVKALGNAVVPAQAKEAFKTLMYGTGYKY